MALPSTRTYGASGGAALAAPRRPDRLAGAMTGTYRSMIEQFYKALS
jgi:hypothetical protein